MNLFGIALIFIGLNIDTFVALLFILPRTKFGHAVVSFWFANLVLWIAGVILSKTFTFLLPTWTTGIMGILLIGLAFKSKNNDHDNIKLTKLFLIFLGLGGDNLAFFISWAADKPLTDIFQVSAVFTVCSLLMAAMGLLIIRFKPVAKLIEQYANYGANLVYVCAGIYIILSTNFFSHILAILT